MHWTDPDTLLRVIYALTGLLAVIMGKRKVKEYRESRRPKARNRHEPYSLEPGPYQGQISIEPPPVNEDAPTLRPPNKKPP